MRRLFLLWLCSMCAAVEDVDMLADLQCVGSCSYTTEDKAVGWMKNT